VAVAWAQACDIRRAIESVWIDTWHWPDALTRRERKKLGASLGLVAEAREEIIGTQASLAEWSKLAGHDRPDTRGTGNVSLGHHEDDEVCRAAPPGQEGGVHRPPDASTGRG
jgi:hypothetical protein